MPNSQDPSSHPHHGHDLTSLIEAMQRLMHTIGSLAWASRLHDAGQNTGASAEVAIADRLSHHLERTAQDADLWSTLPPQDGNLEPSQRRTTRPIAEGVPSGTQVPPPRRTAAPAAQPRVGEQLQRRTLDYINNSLRLARYGDKAGAKLNAELAENAMKTAAQYLPAAEFHEFRHRVEERLHNLDDNSKEPTA